MKIDSSISAVVTGGASGLGRATAEALAASGVKVAIFDINDAPLAINPSAEPTAPVQLNAVRTPPDKIRLSWSTIPGTNYVLQRSNTVPTNGWLEVLNTNAEGTSVSIDLSSTGNAHSFYRVLTP